MIIPRIDIERLLGSKNVDEFKDYWTVEYLPFEEARDYVRKLKLKSYSDWIEYCKSGKKPRDIPSVPSYAYKNKGWINTNDWLGTRRWLPFITARGFVRKLRLKKYKDWYIYCRSGKKPQDIPTKMKVGLVCMTG